MSTPTVSPLRQRMIEDMNARKLCAGTQRGHIRSCKRFAAFLKRSPDTATTEDIRLFQLHLAETGASICNRNRIMTGLRFLFRVTLRRLDLAAEIYHIREPQKIPLVMSADETRRLLAVASSLKVRTLLSLGYGCGLRAGEVVRLRSGRVPLEWHRARRAAPLRPCSEADGQDSETLAPESHKGCYVFIRPVCSGAM
jgi:integrase/recombinase XerD